MQERHQVFIFYAFNFGEIEGRVQHILEKINGVTEIYRSTESLAGRLKQSLHDIIVVVLVINDEKELDRILDIEDLLVGIPIIIVLNSGESQLINSCHRLHPRLVDTNKEATATEAILKSLYRKHLDAVSQTFVK